MTEQTIRGMSIAGAFIGSGIGAGFASGQEHLQFFLFFGSSGYRGLLVAGLLFVVCGSLFLDTAYVNRTQSHRHFLQSVSVGPFVGVFDGLLTAAMMISVSVMLAGAGSLLSSLLPGTAPGFGIGLLAVLTWGIVSLGQERMLAVNGALAFLLVVFIGFVTMFLAGDVLDGDFSAFEGTSRASTSWVPTTWLGSAVIYAGYNLAFCFSLFGALGVSIRSRRDAWIGGIVGGVTLTMVGFAIMVSVVAARQFAFLTDLPMLFAAGMVGPGVRHVYGLGLGFAMLTTAVTATYTLVKRVESRWPTSSNRSRARSTAGVVLAVVPLAAFRFSELVSTVYPLVGYIGAACIGITVLSRCRNKRRNV